MMRVDIADYTVWLANPAPDDHWLLGYDALMDEEGS